MFLVSLVFGIVIATMELLPGTTMAECHEAAAYTQTAIDAHLAVEPGTYEGKPVNVGDLDVVCSYTLPPMGKRMTNGTPA